METNLDYRTKKFYDELIGEELMKKESLSTLDKLKIIGKAGKFAMPLYGDKLMIEGITLGIKMKPEDKSFYLAGLAAGLFVKYWWSYKIVSSILSSYLDKFC